MNRTTYALDLAKRVFQLYWVESDTGEICNRRMSRGQVLQFLGTRAPGRVAMEACGSAHWWARKLQALGHEAVLLHAQTVRGFVRSNKTDAADARAIWSAAGQPEVRPVPLKTETQQAMLGLHRMRSLLVKSRSMQLHQLRGLLFEFGVVYRGGRKGGLAELRSRLAEIQAQVPPMLFGALQEQLQRISRLDEEIAALEARIEAWQAQDADCQRLRTIPGVGALTASAVVATMGDARTFRSGREFAAYLGLVPRQFGTGGKLKLLGISKRGDRYVRCLLVHGARVATTRLKDKIAWSERLRARRPANVAIVAMANKMARTAWALLAHGRTYQHDYASLRPA